MNSYKHQKMGSMQVLSFFLLLEHQDLTASMGYDMVQLRMLLRLGANEGHDDQQNEDKSYDEVIQHLFILCRSVYFRHVGEIWGVWAICEDRRYQGVRLFDD